MPRVVAIQPWLRTPGKPVRGNAARHQTELIRRLGPELRIVLLLIDGALAVAVLGVTGALSPWPWQELPHLPLLAALYPLAWVVALWFHGLYRLRARWTLAADVHRIVLASLWMAFGVLGLIVFLKVPDVSRLFLLLLFPIQAAVTVATRGVVRFVLSGIREHGRNLRNVLVVGTEETAQRFAANLERHRELGLRVAGFLGPETPTPARWPRLGGLDRLEEVLHEHVIDEVAICLPLVQWGLVEEIASVCESEGKITRIPLEMRNLKVATGQLEELDGTPVLSLVPGPPRSLALLAKRAIDVVGSAVLLVLLSPVFLGVALLIVVKDGRPILFRQPRAGLHGRPFWVLKFRTMERDADARRAALRAHNELKGNASFKMTNDPRITPVGKWLRRTSVDELPQLWNVLRGEMSLVGPRPHPFDDVAGYEGWHRRRLSMRPGITGLWQIGSRREADFDRWVQKDLEYIDGWSLLLDIRLLLGTIPALLRAEGR